MQYKNRPNIIFNRDYHMTNYTYTSNFCEEYICKNLSFEAWGIFHKMLSLPPTWHFNMESFAKMYSITTRRLRNNIKLLKEHGFIERKQLTKENGQKGEYLYTLNECPQCVEMLIIKSKNKNKNGDYPNTTSIITDNYDNINEKNLQFDNVIELRA